MNELVENITRQKVNAIEALMAQQPQVDLKVEHYFSEGVYARALEIPAGVQLTGKIHKFEQLNILAKGKMKVLVGDFYKVVKSPFIVVSPPGTKRIAIALEDCVWVTIHGTYETDLELIEKTFIAQDEKEYLEFKNDKQLVLGI
jgi:hypothetical protein